MTEGHLNCQKTKRITSIKQTQTLFMTKFVLYIYRTFYFENKSCLDNVDCIGFLFCLIFYCQTANYFVVQENQ